MRRTFLAVLALLILLAPSARAADVPRGAAWSEATITSADGTELHADILRPKALPEEAKVPVILSIGPYFNHSGQLGAVGPAQNEAYDPVSPSTGPSKRFHDLIEGGELMERGYAFVMVDLRGFGGSGGCLDWVGPGEQADVVAAVEWAASRPWSTGRVGMYGKSYDAVTGLVGAIENPKGLAAVVSQEPVYDMYRYLFANGVRYANSLGTPALYDAIAATPGPLLDAPAYNIGGLTGPACLATNYLDQQNPDHEADYWRERNLIARAAEAKVPVFLTQGFLENNTKPDGTWDLFNALAGPKRGWFGMWDHVRGNDVDEHGRLKMGRPGFFDEVMRFFDHYVREVPLADAPTDKDPPIAVQTSDGTWRSEVAWPPADAALLSTPLRPGSYMDDGENVGTGEGGGHGIWTISPPLAHAAHYAGVARAAVDVVTSARAANLVVNVYDIAPDRQAILLARQTTLVNRSGRVVLDLYGNDWKLPAGHRVGVLVSSSNAEWWLHLPTGSDVQVTGGEVALPFLRYTRDETIDGWKALRLEEWLQDAPFEVPAEAIDGATSPDFTLPGPLTAAPVSAPPKTPSSDRRGRLTVRVARKGRRLVVYGTAPARARVKVKLMRAGRAVRVRRVRTRVNAYRVRLRAPRAGRYRVTVRATKGKAVLRKSSRRVRVR